MKTKEELNALKEEVDVVRKKLHALSEEELSLVTGGGWYTNMECSCGYKEWKPGPRKDSCYRCPSCGNDSLLGVYEYFIPETRPFHL